jgi:hypothetical protein
MQKERRVFRNPGIEYRGAPFWSWNDDLNEKELRWQVREMRRGGLGGGFMHSRIGLATPYLGDKWMDMIAATVDEARRVGFHAWLYDEDRWPSGFGGGLVPARNKEFGLKMLVMVEGPRPHAKCTWCFAVGRDGDRLRAVRKVSAKTGRARKGESILSFWMAYAQPTAWFNDGPYSDNLNPDATDEFIRVTLEAYRKRVGEEFGKTVPGIFTDEPNVTSGRSGVPGAKELPWTNRFPVEFKRRRGWDITDALPYLLFHGERTFKACHDYWRTVAELFAENYTRRIGQWCGRNHLELSGHMLMEESLESQISVGGAVMPHYEYMRRPGIDILREQIDEVTTVKQCSSAARQFGRSRTLSELHGCSGWAFTWEGQKWSGDWQIVLGINTRCQHLTPYSLRGARKRDYPPTFFYHQPWWKYYRQAEDYFGRICYLTSLGVPVRDVLVIHPLSSGWMHMARRDEVARLSESFRRLSEDLLALHYDFDYGDELIMARHGKVRGKEFSVGQARYRLVIIPEADNLLASTVKLLEQYLDSGGTLIVVSRRPRHVDGVEAPRLKELFARPNVVRIACKRAELADALETHLEPRVDIRNEYGHQIAPIIYQERLYAGRTVLLLANRDRDNGYLARVRLAGVGAVEQWDLETGAVRPLSACEQGGRTHTQIRIGPTGSAALVVDPKRRPAVFKRPVPQTVREIELGSQWEAERTTYNGLPLDYCEWRLNGGPWSRKMPVFLAQRQFRQQLGLLDISHSGIPQPWARAKKLRDTKGAIVELRFRFGAAAKLDTPTYLVLESPQNFEITVNEMKVSSAARGWWLEKSFGKVDITKQLRRGDNEIVLRTQYRDEHEIEECYIVGDFAVDRKTMHVTRESRSIRAGDWCDQGYPFYAGSLVYRQRVRLDPKPGEQYRLRIGAHFAACVAVRVNGRLAGMRGWHPYEVDITRLLRRGENVLELEFCGSPRNLLGPNHLTERWPPWTGPGQFVDLDRWTDEYNLQPYGLFGKVTIAVQR